MIQIGLHVRKCAICGKKFDAREEYVYKRAGKYTTIYFCSWSHMREYDRAKKRRPNATPEETAERAAQIQAMMAEGMRKVDIARAMGLRPQDVNGILRRTKAKAAAGRDV